MIIVTCETITEYRGRAIVSTNFSLEFKHETSFLIFRKFRKQLLEAKYHRKIELNYTFTTTN